MIFSVNNRDTSSHIGTFSIIANVKKYRARSKQKERRKERT